jgi:hypothetical protein
MFSEFFEVYLFNLFDIDNFEVYLFNLFHVLMPIILKEHYLIEALFFSSNGLAQSHDLTSYIIAIERDLSPCECGSTVTTTFFSFPIYMRQDIYDSLLTGRRALYRCGQCEDTAMSCNVFSSESKLVQERAVHNFRKTFAYFAK